MLDEAGLLRALRDQAELASDEAAMAVLQTASDAADAEEKAAADAEVGTEPTTQPLAPVLREKLRLQCFGSNDRQRFGVMNADRRRFGRSD